MFAPFKPGAEVRYTKHSILKSNVPMANDAEEG
jgi:hypothetical protein